MKTFSEVYHGTLYSVMQWDQWDEICAQIQLSKNPWYVYSVSHDIPQQPIKEAQLQIALDEISLLLRQDHEESYLGIVYVDDFTDPSLIKIYDPNNLGSSCGSSGRYIPPGWILSRMPPALVANDIPVPNNRRRWWQGLLANLANS